MFRIGILGSENSHAMAFSKMFNGIDKNYEGEFDDMCVVGTFGTDDASNKALIEQAGVQFIADKPEDLLGHVDAVMVTARDGKYHAEYAHPFLEAGLPAFIDKPFTVGLDKADELLTAARESGALLCGGSSLKYLDEMNALARFRQSKTVVGGNVTAPINMVNPYGGFYFYAQHLVEMVCEIFGRFPKNSTASSAVMSSTWAMSLPLYLTSRVSRL